MNVLEKITKEIEERVHMVENIPTHGEDDFLDGEECYEDGRVQGRYEELVWCRGMIHSNMDDAADMNNGWIPVEERLPNREECQKNNREFFVQDENGNRFSCEYDSESNGYDNPKWCCNTMIVAWQNFPQPYKPEEN